MIRWLHDYYHTVILPPLDSLFIQHISALNGHSQVYLILQAVSLNQFPMKRRTNYIN
jgi:hypothetical protein